MICIPLTQGKHAIIDNDDWELVSKHRWHANKPVGDKFYAMTNTTNSNLPMHRPMHRLILGLTDGDTWVDHKDGDTLNNTRSNLRVCTPQQNACNRRIRSDNTSKYKGVSYRKDTGLWRARIGAKGVVINLGNFQDPLDAYGAYCEAAKELHGDFYNPG